MMPPEIQIQNLLESVVEAMVDNGAQASVVLVKGERTHIYRIEVAKDDRGKIIGRNGKNVTALRTLLASWIAKHNFRAVIDIEE